jgi:hypothetical protein
MHALQSAIGDKFTDLLTKRDNKEDFMQNTSVKTHTVQATTTNTTLPLQQIYQLVAKYSIDQQFIIAEYKKNKH